MPIDQYDFYYYLEEILKLDKEIIDKIKSLINNYILWKHGGFSDPDFIRSIASWINIETYKKHYGSRAVEVLKKELNK